MSFHSSTDKLPWSRFWSPRKSRNHGTTSGFFEDPREDFGKHLHPCSVPLAGLIPETGVLVLCGEPGLGKSTELKLLSDKFAAGRGIGEQHFISLQARQFDSFPDLQGQLESLAQWTAWLSDQGRMTLILDGLDEGLIRMPTLVTRLTTFLANKPISRLRLILACRSFEWPEAEGEQLALLWPTTQEAGFVYELEPLCHDDARLAAETRGFDGEKFLAAVHREDVASLASRPITLLFLLKEFGGETFSATSRRQLYSNGCRRLCEEHNPERSRLLRLHAGNKECTTDDKLSTAGKLACALLLGGKHRILFPLSPPGSESGENVCIANDLVDLGLVRESHVEQVLGTGLFTASGNDLFGFAHQTFAECLAAQTLSQLALPQIRSFLCATHPATGDEYVIPQLVELAAWLAGGHPGFFAHLKQVDPGALLRSGVGYASNEQKATLVSNLLELASKNQFFDESSYWRFWKDLDHPGLPEQLRAALESPEAHLMVRRVAIDIAEACRRWELVPTLFNILESEKEDDHFRSCIAEALCASVPDDRLHELEPLAKGQVGPDPDQSILGYALQRLVPLHWSISDVLHLIARPSNQNFYGSYHRALDALPKHLSDSDILAGLHAIQDWEGGFSSTSFRRKLCMCILSRALDLIEDSAICTEMVTLWKQKCLLYGSFFRTGDRDDDDFSTFKDEPRRRWIAAIVESTHNEDKEWDYYLTHGPYRLINPEDFEWILKRLTQAPDEKSQTAWAQLVAVLIDDKEIRVMWWDEFLDVYHRCHTLKSQMSWLEDTSMNTPKRRSAKAHWLWRARRHRRLTKQRKTKNLPNPNVEIDHALSRIVAGESWEFLNLCWSLSLTKDGHSHEYNRQDITAYPGWISLSAQQQEFVHKAARSFLLEHSDGWEIHGVQTNYSDKGVLAIWMLRYVIETDPDLRQAVGTKWIEAVVGMWGSSNENSRELFALVYRINPLQTINSWIRYIRRESERSGHLYGIQRAKRCWDHVLAAELIELIKTLRDPQSIRMAICELRELDPSLAGQLAAYLLRREIENQRTMSQRTLGSLIIAGLEAGSRQVWSLAFPILDSNPTLSNLVMLTVADHVDPRNENLCHEFTDDEISDFYLFLYRQFPPAEDPPQHSGVVEPRQAVAYLRDSVINALSSRRTLTACEQLKRIADVLPDQSVWIHYRLQKTLGAIRQDEWQACSLPTISAILIEDRKRLIRDNSDLMNLIIESLNELQRHLNADSLPAVEDLWMWEGAGLHRTEFSHKDEEAVSDYVARWLRDHIGPTSKVVVNREVQPVRQRRTDILVQAWSLTHQGRSRSESPLSVTIEVKGCWNPEIKTGAEKQLLNQYLRPFRLTHGIFIVAWFHSPNFPKIAHAQSTQLRCETLSEAQTSVSHHVEPAQQTGFEVKPFVLDCRLT